MERGCNMAKRKVEQPTIEIGLLTWTGLEYVPIMPIENRKRFYNTPTSPETDTILKVLSSSKENLAQLPAKTKQVNHNQTIEILENGNKRQITVARNNSTVTLELSDIEKLTGSNKTVKKCLYFHL